MRAGKCRLVYVRFAPPTVWRAVCRRPSRPETLEQAALEERLYAPPGNPSLPGLGQGKEATVRPVISRSDVECGSDRAGEFFIIHVHFLSNKNELSMYFYTDSPSWLLLLPLQKPIIEFWE